jgi:hypothetical protein
VLTLSDQASTVFHFRALGIHSDFILADKRMVIHANFELLYPALRLVCLRYSLCKSVALRVQMSLKMSLGRKKFPFLFKNANKIVAN